MAGPSVGSSGYGGGRRLTAPVVKAPVVVAKPPPVAPPVATPGPAPPPFPGYLTPQQQIDLAKQQAEAFYKPYQDSIAAQQQRAAAATAANSESLRAIAQALAAELGKIAPNVQQAYRTAGQDTSTFSAGYSHGMQLLQQQEAGKTNDLLGRIGAPEGQMQHPGPEAGNVLYGTTGAIPATSLAAQGAAAYSTAAGYPAEALGRGQQDIIANVLSGNKTQQDLSDQLATQLAGLPGKAQDYLAALQKDQRDQGQWYQGQADKQAAATQAQRNADRTYRLAVAKYNQTAAKAGQPRIFGSSSGGYFALDPATGKVTQITDAAVHPVRPQVFGSATSGYYAIDPVTGKVIRIVDGKPGARKIIVTGSDKAGRWAYDPATGQTTQIVPVVPVTAKPAKVTPVPAKTKQFAWATAKEAHNGYETQTVQPEFPARLITQAQADQIRTQPGPPSPNGFSIELKDKTGKFLGYTNWHPPIDYMTALHAMLQMPEFAGLSPQQRLQVAQNGLNQYYKPGEGGRPAQPLQVAQTGTRAPQGSQAGYVAPVDPTLHVGRIDQGIDYATPDPVRAGAAGHVERISTGWAGGTGTGVYIRFDHPVTWHGRTYSGMYSAHTTPLVREGDRVQPGTPIAAAGSVEVGFLINGAPPKLIGGTGAGTKSSPEGYDFLAWLKTLPKPLPLLPRA